MFKKRQVQNDDVDRVAHVLLDCARAQATCAARARASCTDASATPPSRGIHAQDAGKKVISRNLSEFQNDVVFFSFKGVWRHSVLLIMISVARRGEMIIQAVEEMAHTHSVYWQTLWNAIIPTSRRSEGFLSRVEFYASLWSVGVRCKRKDVSKRPQGGYEFKEKDVLYNTS